jgi:MFS family permease
MPAALGSYQSRAGYSDCGLEAASAMRRDFGPLRAVREHPHAGWLAVGTVCFGAFMGQLDASIVLQAFPALQQQFAEPLAAVQWVSLSYLAAAGRVADAVGRELVYICGFGVFTASSIACGLAPGLGWLVGFRMAEALGAAMLQANSVALVVTSVPRARMRPALAIQTAAQALGLAAGPALGGWLVTVAGWRLVFWVNVPVGLTGILAGWLLLRRTRERTPLGRFDATGMGLLAVASTAGLLGLSGISGLGIPHWAVAAFLLAAAVAWVAFGWQERRAVSPLLPLAVLRLCRWGLPGRCAAMSPCSGRWPCFRKCWGRGDSLVSRSPACRPVSPSPVWQPSGCCLAGSGTVGGR